MEPKTYRAGTYRAGDIRTIATTGFGGQKLPAAEELARQRSIEDQSIWAVVAEDRPDEVLFLYLKGKLFSSETI